jgi:hypothetical protein
MYVYNTTHILNLDNLVGVVQPHVAAALTYEKVPCVQRTEVWVDFISGFDVVG